MTEKVVSLSGGLVLGMVFALFLGLGATQNLSQSVHFEMPSIMQMTIAQTTSRPSTPTNDTTAAPSTPPTQENSGRITRIATLTETTAPELTATTTQSSAEMELKYAEYITAPKTANELRRANLLHTSIASNTGSDGSYTSIEQSAAARQASFTSIASGNYGRDGYGSAQSPSFVDDKPHSFGSPAMAQNDPGDDPDITGGSSAKPGPGSDPDFLPDDSQMRQIDPVRPNHSQCSITNGGGPSENDPGNHMISQDPRRRPEMD